MTTHQPCCSPVLTTVLDDHEAEVLTTRLKALADPSRLRIVSLVSQAGELCGCDLTEPLGLSQPTVSHHLKVLTEAGVLTREQRGKWAWYAVDDTGMAAVADALRVPTGV